jgi:hypothetical protein
MGKKIERTAVFNMTAPCLLPVNVLPLPYLSPPEFIKTGINNRKLVVFLPNGKN